MEYRATVLRRGSACKTTANFPIPHSQLILALEDAFEELAAEACPAWVQEIAQG